MFSKSIFNFKQYYTTVAFISTTTVLRQFKSGQICTECIDIDPLNILTVKMALENVHLCSRNAGSRKFKIVFVQTYVTYFR